MNETLTPDVPACPEAAFAITLKGTMDGRDALLTARGATWPEFTANVQRLTGLLDGALPGGPPPAAPPREPGEEAPEDWCVVHGVPMTRQTNTRGNWFSHKHGAGWCKGK